MHFDLNQFRSIVDRNEKIDAIKSALYQAPEDDPPYLSDLIVSDDDAITVALSDMEQEAMRTRRDGLTWRLLVIRDEWGNVPQPGEAIDRIIPINRKTRDGKPVSAKDINRAMVDGSYSKKYEDNRSYTIDEKGCISCSFSDAVYFLKHWGIHGKTRTGITYHPEHSQEPCIAPNGQKLHVWYWRFAEVDNAEYAKLGKRVQAPSNTTHIKRGK